MHLDMKSFNTFVDLNFNLDALQVGACIVSTMLLKSVHLFVISCFTSGTVQAIWGGWYSSITHVNINRDWSHRSQKSGKEINVLVVNAWLLHGLKESWHKSYDITNNVVCATSKGSDQPAHMHSLQFVCGIYDKFCKIKHLLSHGIPFSSHVIKTFQNSPPFSPAKVCILLLAQQLALTFYLFPTTLFRPKVAVIGFCRALALLQKQVNVWVFPIVFIQENYYQTGF